MKKTYTRTLMIRDLSEALVKLYVSEKPKFESNEDDFKKIMIDGIKSWSIIDGEDAEEIKELIGEDEWNEYLEIELLDGKKEYYKNSHVEMFIL